MPFSSLASLALALPGAGETPGSRGAAGLGVGESRGALFVSPAIRRWYFGCANAEPVKHPLGQHSDPRHSSVSFAPRHAQRLPRSIANDEEAAGWRKPPNG